MGPATSALGVQRRSATEAEAETGAEAEVEAEAEAGAEAVAAAATAAPLLVRSRGRTHVDRRCYLLAQTHLHPA